MRLRHACPVAFVIGLTACGSRTELTTGGNDEPPSAQSISTCRAGDPPLTLAENLGTNLFNGLVTDGVRLYVVQSSRFWSLSTAGGGRVDLWSSPKAGAASASTPVPLLAADGGLYFNTFDAPERLVWTSNDGASLRVVSSATTTAFDWSGTRAFTGFSGLGPGSIGAISLADGSVRTFVPIAAGADVQFVTATQRFLHLIVVAGTAPIRYADERFALPDGSLHDEVPLHADNSQIFTGPSAICVLADDARGIDCLSDSQGVDTYVAVTSTAAPFPRYLDADWVYAAVYGESVNLVRFSLDGKRSEVLASEFYPGAVTSFGGCVYVAGGGGTILRVSAP